MMLLYRIYQLCIALPILLVCTMLTAIVTIIGSWIGNAHSGILSRENLVYHHLPRALHSGCRTRS